MKVLYFGIYNPNFSRNRIYMKGLRENGVEVIECCDSSKGFLKYWRLWQKHRALKGKYDALVVGYPGHLLVPFAKLLSHKSIIADLLGSIADAEEHSHSPSLIRIGKSRLIDWLAVHFADSIILESEAQKRFFEKRFGPSKKYRVLYTGADDSVFLCSDAIPKKSFIVLFRGRLTPESGITHVLEAARLLKGEEGIQFRIIGFGQLLSRVKEIIVRDELTNVELISDFLPEKTLCDKMCEASLSLGQFEDNPRLARTIPHKAFESFAMGIPYLAGDAPAIREVVTDGETGFLVSLADPVALAEKTLSLRDDPNLLAWAGQGGEKMFDERFSSVVLGSEFVRLLRTSMEHSVDASI